MHFSRILRGSALTLAIASASPAAIAAAPTIASFTPGSGPLSTSVIITGTGFTSTATVTFAGTSATRAVNTSTKITATVPAAATGPIAVQTGAGTATSTTNFVVTAGVTTAPATVRPGGSITITAAGFAPQSSIDVYLDTTDIALAVSNGAGVVSIPVTLPASTSPGQHWITLDQRSNHLAAQVTQNVSTAWTVDGFAPNGRHYNPFENTLTSANAGKLDALWVFPDSVYGNAAPIVESQNVLFNGGYNASFAGTVWAVNATTGALLWTASPSVNLSGITPVVYGGSVYFAGGSSIFAYKVNCGKAGATCTPIWTQNLAVTITGGLSLNAGMLYAGGSDGNVYPVDPATGAIGTSFYAYDNTSGSIVTPVHFLADGGYDYGTVSSFQIRNAYGDSKTPASFPSAGASIADSAYFLDGNGYLREAFGWSTNLNATHCGSNVAVAYGWVYAGTCTTVGAYSQQTGAAAWIVSASDVSGVTVANGLLFACVNGSITVYDASYGGELFSAGQCDIAPTVVNGIVYAFDGHITALSVDGQPPPTHTARPRPSQLHSNPRLQAVRTPDVIASR